MEMKEKYRLKKMAKLVADYESCLDLGCAESPNPFLKNKKLVGFDIHKEANLTDNYSLFISGDVMHLEDFFKDEKFDCIVAGE